MRKVKVSEVIIFIVLAALLTYLAFCCGTAWYKGVPINDFVKDTGKVIVSPASIKTTEKTNAFLFIGVLVWLCIFAMYLTSRGNFMFGREMGDGRWGKIKTVNKHLKQEENIILSQNLRMGLNVAPKKYGGHGRYLNTIVFGGSGTGKTFYFVTPNLLQANTSFVVVDPAGELYRNLGNFFIKKGYDIKVLNLINMDDGNQYNPFVYCKNQNDFQVLIDLFWKATEGSNVSKSDPFWDDAAKSLMQAIVFYLWETNDTVNFHSISAMVAYAEPGEDKASPLDALFDTLYTKNPDSLAAWLYGSFRKGADKTKQSILQVLNAKLLRTKTDSFARMTAHDTIDLQALYAGEKPCILFLVIPTVNTTYNFLVSTLYMQLFESINYHFMEHGKMKRHLRLIMDEAANIALPDDFDKIPATCRKYNYSIVLILQSISQLKTMFDKERWEGVMANMDTQIYLGSTEQSTHEYFSKALGKATIDYKTRGYKRGLHGNMNENIQITGRELMTPDEVRNLNNDGDECLVFVRGELPIKDKKYDVSGHKNYSKTAGGGGKPYTHMPDRILGAAIKEVSGEYEKVTGYMLDWAHMQPLDDNWTVE